MTASREEALQWFGLLGGGLAWSVQLVLGYGLTAATCSAAGREWGIDLRTWELTVALGAALVVLLAEAASLIVLRETWGVEEDGPPPAARRHFFAQAAAVGNVLFLVIVVLSAVGALAHAPCHGS